MSNPIISDSGSSIKLFVYFFLLGMILTGVYWFNNKFKANRKILIAVLCCYIFSIYILQERILFVYRDRKQTGTLVSFFIYGTSE